jgi:energy-coupling factor transporter ATP-binding protein EcfA2
MFFIVGKAGSGKSTLMRFLAGHKQTSTLLHNWAERRDCVLRVCAHYFWCSGSQLQCSQEGLWRTILYAIAKKDRGLASAMFADRACDDCQTLAQVRKQPWARNDLTRALSLLVSQLEVQKVAVCLFIDGLDEYQGESGDEMMLIGELRQLLRSPYIKICASSSPRNLFEEAFGYEDYQWKLALHLLTRGDMVQWARTRLCEDDAFCNLVDREDRRQDFIKTIVNKAQGVFLWTVLAIREMVREAHQAGTMDELKERSDALPIELGGEKGMYQRIFERSDPRYRKYMARLLLVMLEPEYRWYVLEDLQFLYYDAREATFATRECLGLDDKYRLAWDEKVEEASIQSWAIVSGTSCRGLFLACHQGRSGAHPPGANCQVHLASSVEDTRRQIRKWCPDFVDARRKRCSFLHRSVGEYLSLPEIRQSMTDLAGRGFDPVLTLCGLRLALARLDSGHRAGGTFIYTIARLGYERRDFIRGIMPEFERILYTNWSWVSVDGDDERILDRFWAKIHSSAIGGQAQPIRLCGGFDISRSSQAHAWFLSLLARYGLVWYCYELWSQVTTSDRQATGNIILAGMLFDRNTLDRPDEQADLVQYLLCSGVDTNTEYTWRKLNYVPYLKATLWEAYVDTFRYFWYTPEAKILWALGTLQMLLRDGHADKQCRLPAGKSSLLSALKFEPHGKSGSRDTNDFYWNLFAGQLHEILNAHGLLTREERRVAQDQGWISTKLKAPLSPQIAPTQSVTEPHVRRQFGRWLRKLKK